MKKRRFGEHVRLWWKIMIWEFRKNMRDLESDPQARQTLSPDYPLGS